MSAKNNLLTLKHFYRRHSPSFLTRSPSPRQHRYDHRQQQQYHDGLGFSETVNNVVEIQRHVPHPENNYKRRIKGKIFC